MTTKIEKFQQTREKLEISAQKAAKDMRRGLKFKSFW